MRKAKIVDTIGPASESLENLTELVKNGMDVARLNRSHGTTEDHLKVYNNVRQASKTTGRNVAALVDLQGPKIRCGWFKKNADGEDKVQLETGQEFVITTEDIEGDEHITSTTFKGLPGDCHAGDPVLIDDGKVRLEVTKVEGNKVYTKVLVGGPVSSHKGINLPGVAVSLPALTEKDEADLRWAIQTGADIIAMSFVRFATDIDRAHEIMDEEGRRIPIIAKIEKPQAVENLEEIVKAFDGIMVARGDMAVEMPFEEVPLVTKRCIELSREYAKPVIVATEVLGSMVNSPIPTRAEASDCANAVLDGADATMTSNETAVGKYPAQTVNTMARISGYATEHGFNRIPSLNNLDMSSTGAVSSAAVDLADKINAKAIVAYTQTGSTVHRVSRERPAAPIYGITNNEHTYHWLALSWGTEGFCTDADYHDMNRHELMVFTDKLLRDAGKVVNGDKIVVLSSAQGEHKAGRTDSLYVHTVGACDTD
ncbi:pyruvate kinase [Bifidobacterium sp. ESL0745]|uniref:pyruvate kinase n=1 Tax=Bifidobacterium sp. ESL0745 TaxID=2983226 RepID=UPI0023F689DE|nr:pyruvate kinase [Bifidobacterium sp. ESL0745]MDF7665203.1 pyruvate kinase [Bifidobacterium sp. ESL0745]